MNKNKKGRKKREDGRKRRKKEGRMNGRVIEK